MNHGTPARGRLMRLVAVGMAAALLAAGCTSGGDDDTGSGGRVQLRWFVGLGAGSDAPTIPAQEEVVEAFNASQDRIHLTLEIVDADQAPDVLSTQIATGNAPDIVGPMGIRGRSSFPGLWLDLTPHIERTNYDLGDFDDALVDFYRIEEEGQIGLPFAVFPSFLFVNLDLFDEAGLPYPPQEYGAPYVDADGTERPWNIDTLRDLALRLTVDADGNDATDPAFDPESIVQFGFGNIFADPRAMATLFGAGSVVDPEGNAVIPPHWEEALNWYYDGMWRDHFIPNGPYGDSDLMNQGSWFESGNLAMGYSHLWYATCCIAGLEARWDTGVVPEVNGQVTAKLHADTFGITAATEHPEEAFEVLTYLIGDAAEQLTLTYGGMPARFSLQDGYFERVNAENFPDLDINWDVVVAGMSHVDNPSHEGPMPNFLEANAVLEEFGTLLEQDGGLDLSAELPRLRDDLQRVFDAAS